MRIRAASTIVASLVGIVDAVAVLRAVHDAHIMVADAARVLAVFIITRAAAVLHRCSYRAATALWLCWCGLHWAWFCAAASCEVWTSAAMEDECGSAGVLTACVGPWVRAPQQNRASVERHTRLKTPVALPVDAVA